MKPNNFYIAEQLYIWRQMTMARYAQLCSTNGPNFLATAPAAYLNHPLNWSCQSQIVIHAASAKLVQDNSYYGPLTLAFACVGGQSPRMIRSKQSITAFKLVKHCFMGGFSGLRRKHLLQFQYKLCWLAPKACLPKDSNKPSVGVQYFAFPELDLLDHNAFEKLRRFELHFVTKRVT